MKESKMRALKTLFVIVVGLFLGIGLISFSGCGEETAEEAQDTMEEAGEDIEEGAEEAGDAIEEGADELEDEMD
jgi:hypothetical protein